MKPSFTVLLIIMVLMSTNHALLQAQEAEYVYQTFKSTRLVNTQSVETLQKRRLDIRIGHRFGDIAGDFGGWSTLYGLEAVADVMIGAAYGITDNLTVGLNRTKGAGDLKMLINTNVKYRLLAQKTDNSIPVSLSLYGNMSISTMQKVDNPTLINNFPNFSDRMAFAAQVLVARKFNDYISLQLTPSYVHRNSVLNTDDTNGLFSLGLAGRFAISRHHAILIDATLPFSSLRTSDNGYHIPMGIGWEIDTGGHRFQINLVNSRGFMENDYIPYSTDNWLDGQFRIGFIISRWFNL